MASDPITSDDREVAIREIFKQVLSTLRLAATSYELCEGSKREEDYAKNMRHFQDVHNMGCGAYRDIFLSAEWRHDRNAATASVTTTLEVAGLAVTPEVASAVVEAVMAAMPGSAKWEAGGEDYWFGRTDGWLKP